MKKSILPTALLLALASSCVGTRSTGDRHTVHAESFHLLGLEIPGDDPAEAWAHVPEGAEIVTVRSSPSDWTSLTGILTNLLGVSGTEITWREAGSASGK